VYTDAAAQTVTDSNVFRPAADNTKNLGNASFRWANVYAGNGSIITVSDEREKQQIQEIDAAALRAWGRVNYRQFKFNQAVETKGDGARWHFGVMAQQVKEAFEAEGLDAFEYGLLCYDEWEDQYEAVLVEVDVQNSDGSVSKVLQGNGEKRIVVPAGDRYGIRYEEALALECAYLRSKLEA
jgi:phage-related tail protein